MLLKEGEGGTDKIEPSETGDNRRGEHAPSRKEQVKRPEETYILRCSTRLSLANDRKPKHSKKSLRKRFSCRPITPVAGEALKRALEAMGRRKQQQTAFHESVGSTKGRHERVRVVRRLIPWALNLKH